MRSLPRLTLSVFAALAAMLATVASPAAALTGPATAYVAVVEGPEGKLTVAEFSASTSRQFTDRVDQAAGDGRIVGLDVNRAVQAMVATDRLRSLQWALDTTTFEEAWSLTNGTGVTVAVLDTGVQANHEDLAGQVLTGWDAIKRRPGGTTDPNGHGTHVAGIVAAVAGNTVGIAGAAPGVRILPVRVLDSDGSGKMSHILEGIIWAADAGARVINLSLGGAATTTTYKATLEYALGKGAVVVAAAGNNAHDGNELQYPAADAGAIAVGSITSSETRSSFSNHGPHLELAAPGQNIVSTLLSGYDSWSGTSMAAPYVSAAAALVAARHPGLTPAQIRELLTASARDLGAPGWDHEFGAGLVDPAAALSLAAPVKEPLAVAASPGYWVVGADGRVATFGSALFFGDPSATPLAAPIVAAARTATGGGYWLAGADGAVFAYGDAAFLGSAQPLSLSAPIVGMAATQGGQGYWLIGRDGGVFSFGDAAFYGSTGAMTLNQPVVDMAPTPTGSGYWLVASDGGVFSFGDAHFGGSTGSIQLNRPMVSLAASDAGGYWMVGQDGGIFAFDVPFHGSLPGLGVDGLPDGQRIRATTGGAGYYILGVDGQVFPFAAALGFGSPAGPFAAVDLVLAP